MFSKKNKSEQDYSEPSSDKAVLERLYIIVIYKNIEKARQEQRGNDLKEEASNVAENSKKYRPIILPPFTRGRIISQVQRIFYPSYFS